MASIQANLYIVSRISSVKKSVDVRFEERRAPSAARARKTGAKSTALHALEPNHLMIGLYSQQSVYYQLLHDGWVTSPTIVRVTKSARGKPTDAQLRAAAMECIQGEFPSMSLGALPTSGSYWTGSYWLRPKPAQFAAGFQFLGSDGKPIEGNLRIQSTAGKPAYLRMDFVAVVQSR